MLTDLQRSSEKKKKLASRPNLILFLTTGLSALQIETVKATFVVGGRAAYSSKYISCSALKPVLWDVRFGGTHVAVNLEKRRTLKIFQFWDSHYFVSYK